MESFGQFLSVVFVLSLAGLAAWWLRKGRPLVGLHALARANKLKRMQLVQRLALTPQHYLCVIRVDDSEWVIGIYPNGMKVIRKSPSLEEAKPDSSGNGVCL